MQIAFDDDSGPGLNSILRFTAQSSGTYYPGARSYSQAQIIDLNDGTFSNIGGLTGNVAIAFNATIENAVGGSGADSIIGNSVSNVLTGGAGSDAFYFKDPLSSALNVDRITDFNVADDTIWLDSRVFAALAPGGPLSADAFHAGQTSADASDRIMYDSSTGVLFYDRDGAGGYAAVHFADVSRACH